MSQMVRNCSSLLRRLSFSNRLLSGNNLSFNTKTFGLRSLSSISSNEQNLRLNTNLTSIVSKRFATNLQQSDRDLNEFLKSEIELEKSSQTKALPSMKGWGLTSEGSNVTLTKKYKNEDITVKVNVNHAVDSEGSEDDLDENRDQLSGQMVCKPDFAVEIKKGNTIMGINCSYIEDEAPEGPEGRVEDLDGEFQINEISVFDGEFNENSYAVAGDVMDGSMYDLLMDLLRERGIDQEFGKQLVEYTTVYEHSQYVGLLERLQRFLSQK